MSLQSTGEQISILVADSSPMTSQLLAEGLRRLRSDFNVVGAVSTVRELLDQANNEPAVALVSVNLQDGPLSGYKAVRELRATHPASRIIMLLDRSEQDLVVSAFRAGARGVFFRIESLDQLGICIQKVHAGKVWAGSTELEFLLEALFSMAPLRTPAVSPAASLTRREADVVSLVANGMTNREISRKLNLSEHTVKNYLFRIFDKLGVASRVELALYAYNHGQTLADSPHSNAAA